MTVLRTQLSGVSRRPARLLLTGLGIIVAAFFAFATVLAQQITEQTIADNVSDTPAGASVVMESKATPMTPATLIAVQKTPGVTGVAGRVLGSLQIRTGSAPDSSPLYFGLAADPGSGPLARVKVTSGSYPDKSGEIAITARTAERDGLQVGQKITAANEVDVKPDGTPILGPPTQLVITGVVKAPEDSGQMLYTQDRAAATLLGTGYSRIDVQAAPGASVIDLTTKLTSLVQASGTGDQQAESGPQVRPATEVRTAEINKKVEEIQPIFALLSMFVAIAVIAAALVVTSTFRIMFAQRMKQLALLRAVGAGRGRLTGALIVEGALTGLVAGVTGVLIALGAGFLTPVVLGAFGYDLPAPGVPIGWAVAIVLGSIAITVIAVLAPAFSAARVSPLQALRASATTNARIGIGIFRALTGAVLVLAAAGTGAIAFAAAGPLKEDTTLLLLTIVASGTAAFCALLALGPVLIRPLLGLVGWPVSRFGPVGRLAVGGVGGAPRRAAAVSAVVALGVTLIAGVLVGSSTLSNLADRELALEYPADIEARMTEEGRGLPKDLAQRLEGRDELAEVLPYRQTTAFVGENEMRLVDLDIRALPTVKKFTIIDGSIADLGPGRLALPDIYTDRLHVKAGDDVRFTADGRQVTVKVGVIIDSAGPLGGAIILHPGDLTKFDPSAPATGVLVNAKGTGKKAVTAARAAVLAEVGNVAGVSVDTLADQREEVTTWITILTAIALGLLGLTVLIAVVGVGTTTALSVVERTKESGMLRAVGLSRGGLRTSLATEAGLYGVVGSFLGLALGIPYAALMLRSLDIGAEVVIPAGQLVAVFAILAGLTALAGLLPANRAAKVSPVAALAHE